MNRMIRISFVILSAFVSLGAQAAIFDSLDSVDQLKVIAEQRTQKTDRMPAGKAVDPSKDDDTANATAPKTDEKKEN
ncbi:MAG: hypothetical protein JST04_11735 [Bdellovibrionales bacterium]|nr:hypothetical protein [Bdellovibrionales bacterium]